MVWSLRKRNNCKSLISGCGITQHRAGLLALGWDMGSVWAQLLLTEAGAGWRSCHHCSAIYGQGPLQCALTVFMTLPKRTNKTERKTWKGYKSPKLKKINLCAKSWGTWQERVTLCHLVARKNSLRFSIVCRFFSMRTEGWAQGELSGGKIEGIIEKMGLVHNWSDRVLPTPSLWLKYARPPAQ